MKGRSRPPRDRRRCRSEGSTYPSRRRSAHQLSLGSHHTRSCLASHRGPIPGLNRRSWTAYGDSSNDRSSRCTPPCRRPRSPRAWADTPGSDRTEARPPSACNWPARKLWHLSRVLQSRLRHSSRNARRWGQSRPHTRSQGQPSCSTRRVRIRPRRPVLRVPPRRGVGVARHRSLRRLHRSRPPSIIPRETWWMEPPRPSGSDPGLPLA